MAKLLQTKSYAPLAGSTIKRSFFDGINLYTIEDYTDNEGFGHSRLRIIDINGIDTQNVFVFNGIPGDNQMGNYGFAVNPASANGQPRYFFAYSLPNNDDVGGNHYISIATFDSNRVLLNALNTNVMCHANATATAKSLDNLVETTYNVGQFKNSDLIFGNGTLWLRFNNDLHEINQATGETVSTISLNMINGGLSSLVSVVYDGSGLGGFWALSRNTDNSANMVSKFGLDGAFIVSFSDSIGNTSNNNQNNTHNYLVQVPSNHNYVLKQHDTDNDRFIYYAKREDPSRVSISIPEISVPADGLSNEQITISVMDSNNNRVNGINITAEVAGYIALNPLDFTIQDPGNGDHSTLFDGDESTYYYVGDNNYIEYDSLLAMRPRVIKYTFYCADNARNAILTVNYYDINDILVRTETKTAYASNDPNNPTTAYLITNIDNVRKIRIQGDGNFQISELAIAVTGNIQDGRVDPANGITDANGQFTTTFTSGNNPGKKHIVATASF